MGGGKTYNGLLKHLLHVNNPHYRGVVIRSKSTTIMKPAGIFDEAHGLFKAFNPKVKPNRKDQSFTFPSGANISFRHLATDKDAELFRGSQYSHAMIDEATEIDHENHVWMVLSRIRSRAEIPPQLVLTCNPNPDSFIRKWIDWWLYPKDHEHAGRPDPEKDGVERWFLRQGDQMIWRDTRQELLDEYGDPNLPDDHDDQVQPMSFCFYPATIDDNPPLKKYNPQYKVNLQNLPPLKRERDLYGNWDIRESESSYFDRNWCEEWLEITRPEDIEKIVRAWDFAGTLPSDMNRSPDYTASVKMAKLRTGEYVVLDITRHRLRFGEWLPHMLDIASEDGMGVSIVLSEDPNPHAKASMMLLAKDLLEAGYTVHSKRSSQGKLDSFRPFASAAQLGFVKFISGCGRDFWNRVYNTNEFAYGELERFTGKRKGGENGHDDVVDCCSLAYTSCATMNIIPVDFLSGISGGVKNNSPLLRVR